MTNIEKLAQMGVRLKKLEYSEPDWTHFGSVETSLEYRYTIQEQWRYGKYDVERVSCYSGNEDLGAFDSREEALCACEEDLAGLVLQAIEPSTHPQP